MRRLLIVVLLAVLLVLSHGGRRKPQMRMDFVEEPEDNMVLSGVKGKALFLFKDGKKKMFPDFHTFTAMGFDQSSIRRMKDEKLATIPQGDNVQAIAPPPTFREEDWSFHRHCEDPPALVNDLGVIANNGDLYLQSKLVQKVKRTKKIEILALGGSITAGGYFEGFLKLMREEEELEVVIHNHGHGATDLTYTIFCIEMDHYSPDLVLIDFSVNDNDHPKLMEGLLRKALTMGKTPPVVAIVNFWVASSCPPPRYLIHAQHYNVPLLNVCPAVNLCYGRDHMPKWRYSMYSETDGVHPWGKRGVPFIGEIMHAWWLRMVETTESKDASISSSLPSYNNKTNNDNSAAARRRLQQEQQQQGEGEGEGEGAGAGAEAEATATARKGRASNYGTVKGRLAALPPALYENSVGACTRCDALADDADGALEPVESPSGFHIKTRVKIGFGGFNPNDNSTAGMTKSFKRSYQAESPGDKISFKFYGKELKVALWQRRDGMGVLEAMIDNDPAIRTKATGFFKGYTWAMERNNTGRSEVVPLFDNLEDKEHVVTFTVSGEAANPFVKGHTCQIFALLSASDDTDCKDKVGGRHVKAVG